MLKKPAVSSAFIRQASYFASLVSFIPQNNQEMRTIFIPTLQVRFKE